MDSRKATGRERKAEKGRPCFGTAVLRKDPLNLKICLQKVRRCIIIYVII
jgi:hypothetical protein